MGELCGWLMAREPSIRCIGVDRGDAGQYRLNVLMGTTLIRGSVGAHALDTLMDVEGGPETILQGVRETWARLALGLPRHD